MGKQVCRFVRYFLWLLILILISSCTHSWFNEEKSSDPHSVVFKRTHRDTIPADQTRLKGWLKKPAGEGPFPAVVMLIDTELRAPGDREWEERLVSWGYVVLNVDSMGSRGIALYDYGPGHNMNLYWHQHTSRANDALDAKNYLAGLPFVNSEKIAVIGWGYGGRALFNGVLDSKDPFQAVVNFYGGCPQAFQGFNAPLMVMTWEGPSKYFGNICRSMMVPPEQNIHEVSVNIYPVEYLGYDLKGQRWLKYFHNIAAEYYRIVDYKYNPEVGPDAILKVKNFLAKYLQRS